MRVSRLAFLGVTLLGVWPLLAAPIFGGSPSEKLVFSLPHSTEIRWVPESIAVRRGELQVEQFGSWELSQIAPLIAGGNRRDSGPQQLDEPPDCTSTSITFGTIMGSVNGAIDSGTCEAADNNYYTTAENDADKTDDGGGPCGT